MVLYLLSCNAGEVMLMFFAALVGWPTPLLPIQLLWINLITDGLPALTLGMERPDRNIMSRPPSPPREPVVSRARGGKILAYGVLFAMSMGLGFGWMRRQENTSVDEARTVTFCVACFGQMLFAFGCRSDWLTFPQIGLFTNRPMLLAIGLSAALQMTTILVAPLRSIFGTVPLSVEHWLLVAALSIVPVTALEVIKLVRCRLPQTKRQLDPAVNRPHERGKKGWFHARPPVTIGATRRGSPPVRSHPLIPPEPAMFSTRYLSLAAALGLHAHFAVLRRRTCGGTCRGGVDL